MREEREERRKREGKKKHRERQRQRTKSRDLGRERMKFGGKVREEEGKDDIGKLREKD